MIKTLDVIVEQNENSPLENKCLKPNIVYEATITNNQKKIFRSF